MAVRRLAYTRKQVAILLAVSERTLIRWSKEGRPPHAHKNPEDPKQQCFYDREEIDRIVKKTGRRVSRHHRVELAAREVPLDLAAYEPAVPGPVAAAIYEMLGKDVPIEQICARLSVAPEHVIRLDRLRRQFEAERARAPQRSEPRIVMDDDDPEIAAWGRELDERRQRGADFDDAAASAEPSDPQEGGPPSSAA